MPSPYELFDSRETNKDLHRSSQTRRYVLDDAVDEDDAISKIEAEAPSTVTIDGYELPRRVKVQSLNGEQLYSATATYRYISNNNTQADGGGDKVHPTDIGESSFSFDFSGRQVHVEQAVEADQLTYSYDAAKDAAWQGFVGMDINKDNDGHAHGTEVIVPQGIYTETHIVDPAVVDQAWIAQRAKVIGKTNDLPFGGYSEEELLFTQFSGQRTANGLWRVTFGMTIEETKVNLSVRVHHPGTGATVTRVIPEKRGWRFLHYRQKVCKVGDKVGLYNVAAHIAKVYETEDFATELGI